MRLPRLEFLETLCHAVVAVWLVLFGMVGNSGCCSQPGFIDTTYLFRRDSSGSCSVDGSKVTVDDLGPEHWCVRSPSGKHAVVLDFNTNTLGRAVSLFNVETNGGLGRGCQVSASEICCRGIGPKWFSTEYGDVLTLHMQDDNHWESLVVLKPNRRAGEIAVDVLYCGPFSAGDCSHQYLSDIRISFDGVLSYHLRRWDDNCPGKKDKDRDYSIPLL